MLPLQAEHGQGGGGRKVNPFDGRGNRQDTCPPVLRDMMRLYKLTDRDVEKRDVRAFQDETQRGKVSREWSRGGRCGGGGG